MSNTYCECAILILTVLQNWSSVQRSISHWKVKYSKSRSYKDCRLNNSVWTSSGPLEVNNGVVLDSSSIGSTRAHLKWQINPFLNSGLVHFYHLDESISSFRGECLPFIVYCKDIPVCKQPEVKIRGGIEDNSRYFFLISWQKHMLWPLIRTVSVRWF